MFTGIIEEVGTVQSISTGGDWARITTQCRLIPTDIKIGDSICLSGVCLTATASDSTSFTADVMSETLSRSCLGMLRVGSKVNLERALTLSGRLGGHIVSGHIDGMGKIESISKNNITTHIVISAAPNILRYTVEKGSIAIDGISLTVGEVTASAFEVFIIPHTGSETTLLHKSAGDYVNLECDIIAKYLEKLHCSQLDDKNHGTGIDLEFLQRHGF